MSAPRALAGAILPRLRGLQCPAHGLGLAGDNGEICARRVIRLRGALFPIAQRAQRNTETRRELLLGKTKRTTDDFHARSTLHALEMLSGERLGIRIAQSSSAPLLRCHPIEAAPFVFFCRISCLPRG